MSKRKERNLNCPICGENAILTDRCFYGGSFCDNGHAWFYCPIDKNRVIGEAPTKYEHTCHCSLIKTEDNKFIKENGKEDKALEKLKDMGADLKENNIRY